MSTWAVHEVECPSCGHGFEVALLKGMHITRLPEVRAEILAGTFQVFTCPACDAPTGVERPTVYTDFESRLYIALELDGADEILEHRARHQQVFDQCFVFGPDIAADLGQAMRCRLVLGVRALREKVLAFHHGLDDHVLEGLKLAAAGERGWDLTETQLRLLAVHEGGHLLLGRYPFEARTRPSARRVVSNDRAIEHVTMTADEVDAMGSKLADLRGHVPWLFEPWVVDATIGSRVWMAQAG